MRVEVSGGRFEDMYESISGYIEYSEKVKLFIGSKDQLIGEIIVVLNYKCGKLLGRCYYDEFYLFPEIEIKAEQLRGQIKITRLRKESRGKFKLEDSGYVGVKVNIGSGRSLNKDGEPESSLTIVYALKGRAIDVKNIGKYDIELKIFVNPKAKKADTWGRDNWILLGNIKIEVEIVNPIEKIEIVEIIPTVEHYVVEDPVKLKLAILSKYRGSIHISTSGAVKPKDFDFEINDGENKFHLDGIISAIDKKIIVHISLPDIGYEDEVSLPLNVINMRINIDRIVLEDTPKLGEKTRLKLVLLNLSFINQTFVKIITSLYGYKIEKNIVLNPGEKSEVMLETPNILTRESCATKERTIIIEDMTSRQKFSKDLDLPNPLPLDIVFKPKTQNLKILSSSSHNVIDIVDVKNAGNKNIKLSLIRIKPNPSICSITIDDTYIEPNSDTSLAIKIKPLKLGQENIELEFGIIINDIITDTYQTNISIEIFKSFKIKKYGIITPSTSRVVKNQKINVKIDIDVLGNSKARLEVISDNLKLDTTIYDVNPGENTIDILGKTVDYADDIKIEISDGVVRERLILPIKIEKPLVNISYEFVKLFKGLEKSIVLVLTKDFEVPIKIAIDIIETSNLQIYPHHTEITMDIQQKKENIVINARGIDEGKARIRFKITSTYISDEGVVDSWSDERYIDFEVLIPTEIRISNKPNEILLPYPVKPVENVIKFIHSHLTVEVKNISDRSLPQLSINIIPGTDIQTTINPVKVSLQPNEITKFTINLSIPINYGNEKIRAYLSIINEEYILQKIPLEIPIKKYLYSIAVIPKEKFLKECTYPGIHTSDKIYTLLPLWISSPDVCGKPTEQSIRLFDVMKLIINTIKNMNEIQMLNDPWNTAASIIFKTIAHHNPSYTMECEFLQNIVSRTRIDIKTDYMYITPALLWALTLKNLIPKCRDVNIPPLVMEQIDKSNLIHTKDIITSKKIDNLYGELLRYIMNKDSKIYEVIQNYVKKEYIPPLLLLYVLNNGKELPYYEEVANKLYNKNKITYLLYIILSDNPVVKNIDVLNKITESISYLKENKIKILISTLLLNKIINSIHDIMQVSDIDI